MADNMIDGHDFGYRNLPVLGRRLFQHGPGSRTTTAHRLEPMTHTARAIGILITIVSCKQGLGAEGGAEGVGRATMRSVVYSFLLILVANYLLLQLVYQPFLRHLSF